MLYPLSYEGANVVEFLFKRSRSRRFRTWSRCSRCECSRHDAARAALVALRRTELSATSCPR